MYNKAIKILISIYSNISISVLHFFYLSHFIDIYGIPKNWNLNIIFCVIVREMFLQSVVFLILWNIYLSFGTQNDLKLMRQNLNSSTHGKQKRALYFTTTTGISVSTLEQWKIPLKSVR